VAPRGEVGFGDESVSPTMVDPEDTYDCETCGASVAVADARRSEPFGDLDPATWQTLNCPHCGDRLATVLVGDE
jgi:DNA-directed RNA polymerase subunit RPC12/RpoP